MTLPLTPARYGDGLMYAVWMPGMQDGDGASSPEILCDPDDIDSLFTRAAVDGYLSFRGVTTTLTLPDGATSEGVVGVGRVPYGPESGVFVRYHDRFVGPVDGDDDDGDDDGDRQQAPSRPAAKPSGFPRIN